MKSSLYKYSDKIDAGQGLMDDMAHDGNTIDSGGGAPSDNSLNQGFDNSGQIVG